MCFRCSNTFAFCDSGCPSVGEGHLGRCVCCSDLGRCVRYSPSSGLCACVYVNSKDVMFGDLLVPLLGPTSERPSFQAPCVCGYVYMSVCMCSFFLSASRCCFFLSASSVLSLCLNMCCFFLSASRCACVCTRLCVLT